MFINFDIFNLFLADSKRVFEEFKGDLKLVIVRIDQQLKEKVDFDNIGEFERKLDQKISGNLNKKLDKMELKKNNNMINKKVKIIKFKNNIKVKKLILQIDHLENKISKTLVETLVDLQLEDIPLISKKGPGGDKCVSCNQIIQTNPTQHGQHNHNQIYQNQVVTNSNTDITMSPANNNRFQMKNIQDYSNRLGFGSYSRILNAMTTEPEEKSIIPNIPELVRKAPSSNHNNRKNVNISSENPNHIKFSNLIFTEPDKRKNKKDDIRKSDINDKYADSSSGISNVNADISKSLQNIK